MKETMSSTTINHNSFGGRIYESDFDTEHCSGAVAERIFSDRRFDEQCRKNSEYRENCRLFREAKRKEADCEGSVN